MKKRKKIVIVVSFVMVLSIAILGYGAYVFKDVLFSKNKFIEGIKINGIDVSGLNKNEAQDIVSTTLMDKRDDVVITLKYEDKKIVWKGEDFEIDNQINPYVEDVFNYFNQGNILEKKEKYSSLNKEFNVSYDKIFTGLKEKIKLLAEKIDIESKNATFVFNEEKDNPLEFTKEEYGYIVNQEKLIEEINNKLITDTKIEVIVPIEKVEPVILKEDLEKRVAKRGSFKTNYSKSGKDRKHNIVKALSYFNGMKVKPEQEISFNNTTGKRTIENGYKKANIILNGVYVEGTGGGVCQASTTLYNALLNADIEILEVRSHTLPASYVWLAFDAMVSEGYSDLRFKNNTESDLYIKTYYDNDNVYVDIYGQPFDNNYKVVRRAEFIESINHPGDKIVADTNKQYSNKVTYKGEYLRLKYPKEGYRAKGYIDRYRDGVLIESKLIRDETYKPQSGIIIEGTEELKEGITIPPNKVVFIPPQDKSVVTKENVGKKIEKDNPSIYNP